MFTDSSRTACAVLLHGFAGIAWGTGGLAGLVLAQQASPVSSWPSRPAWSPCR